MFVSYQDEKKLYLGELACTIGMQTKYIISVNTSHRLKKNTVLSDTPTKINDNIKQIIFAS